MRAGIDAACRPGVRADLGRQLRRQARAVPLPPARGDGMSDAVVLTLRAPLDQRVDIEGLTPDRCASLTKRRIAALPVTISGPTVAAGNLFNVRGNAAARLEFEGDLSRVDGLGAGVISGELVVHGDAGDNVGLAIAAGWWRSPAHPGQRGSSSGRAHARRVQRDDRRRDPRRRERGRRCRCARVRRGLVVIGGSASVRRARHDCRDAGGSGNVGDHPGEGNKRGSLIAAGAVRVPASYRYACTYKPPFVRLLMTHLLRNRGMTVAPAVRDGLYRRHRGDAGGPGKGEVLTLLH